MIELDTPGGLDTSMRQIVQGILACPVPVAEYVSPGGARAASAIARQTEAERERPAKVIHAEGEKQATVALLEAAQMLAQQPEAMQLRYLQTMTQVAGERASTIIVFPRPMDLLGRLLDKNREPR